MNLSWIPVSERLPEDEQEILFSTKTGRVHSGKYHDDDSANQWYSHRDKCRAWNNVVTAWMPLPKPYKEGEDMTEEQYKQLTDIPKSKTETEQAELLKYIKQYCIRNYEYIRLRDPEIEAENVMNILDHIISMIDDNTQG